MRMNLTKYIKKIARNQQLNNKFQITIPYIKVDFLMNITEHCKFRENMRPLNTSV